MCDVGQETARPLAGMRLLAFSHYLQGPAAAQYLADMGADVIKVEPLTGAFERRPLVAGLIESPFSGLFLSANRNQRSLAVDLKTVEGAEIVRRLVTRYDVVIENYRSGVMAKLGLSFEDLTMHSPNLIYASSSGFGSGGPFAHAPNQDLLAQAMTGLIAATGPSRKRPVAVGASIADQHAAALLALGVLAAFARRLVTGKGGKVEGNLLGAAVDLQMEAITHYLNRSRSDFDAALDRREELANWYHPAPYGIYRLADAAIALSLTTAEKLCAAFDDERLAPIRSMDPYADRDRYAEIVATVLIGLTYAEVSRRLAEAGIWFARIDTYVDLERHPQAVYNNLFGEVRVGQKAVRVVNHPLRYDGATPAIRLAPPGLGEHTRAILEELAYSIGEIDALVEKRVVAVS